MPRLKHAELLLQKASQGEYVLDLMLRQADAPLEPFGLHAQQATEKMLKAAIKASGPDYPLTHDIARLMRVLSRAGTGFPDRFKPLCALVPFSGDYRYDALPDEGEAELDLPAIRELIRDLRAWVEAYVADADLARGA